MRPRPRTRPSGSLPSLHALQLRRLIELYDAVDLAVRMRVIPARINVLAVHVDGRDAEEAIFRSGKSDFATAVAVAIELGLRDPAFLEPLEDVFAEVLVVGTIRAIMGVQALF